MPKLDKTGPEGKGPKTGRGLGKCTEELLSKSALRRKRIRDGGSTDRPGKADGTGPRSTNRPNKADGTGPGK